MPEATTSPMTTNEVIENQLSGALRRLEEIHQADAMVYMGPIANGIDDMLRHAVESLPNRNKKLLFLLETGGGSIEVAERIVTVLRHHYEEVDFLVPNFAYSAGTILAMSGDSIWMDYYSVLGPIDPQVNKVGVGWVPALGYLHRYEELVQKAKEGTITSAEISYLCERFDPAELHSFEQAREQTVSLLQEWLVQWKFKDWHITEGRKTPVTDKMKQDRAQEIAHNLNNTKRWHSHGRGISRRVLADELKLKIEDIDDSKNGLADAVRSYYKLLRDFLSRLNAVAVIHSRANFSPIEV